MPRKPIVRKAKTARRTGISARPMRTKKPDTLEMLVVASAEALALTLDSSWQAGAKRNLELLLHHAAFVDEFPLPDDCDPAPVFRA
jgi:hypothetical protein